MIKKALPPELISLVHHVELNKAGWWEDAIQRLIVAAIWLANRPLNEIEVRAALQEQFSVVTGAARLRTPFARLISDGTLLEVPPSGLQISQQALRRFEKDLQEGDDLEKRAKSRFLACMQDCCPSTNAESAWKAFTEQLLLPLVSEVGARAYQLVAGKNPALEDSVSFPEFLEQYPKEIREQVRGAVISFLDPKDIDARSYVLRFLHGCFFVEAGNLSQETVQSLMDVEKGPPSFNVFVDTNFLFSILNFHDNPSNEAAEALMKVIGQLSPRIKCKLYVHPLTVDETKHVVQFHRDNFKYIDLKLNMAAAALDTSVSGISHKYLSACTDAGRVLSSEEYFGPYLTDLIPILRSRGIELYNQPVGEYSKDQRVIDDILHQIEFQKQRHTKRTKTYEELRHDVTLWHFVRDKRPPLVESPLQAKFFVTTVDYFFLGFDIFKCRLENLAIPICLHPSALMQLLQFWVPRSAALDEAMVGSLRSRFLFYDFDPKAEKVTLRILERLSRFEEVGDIPTDLIKALLVNEALRQTIIAEKDVQKQIELVREALQVQGLVGMEKLKEAEAKAESLRSKVELQDQTISGLQARIAEYDVSLTETQQAAAGERALRESVETRVSELESNQKEALNKSLQRKARNQFACGSIFCLALVIGVVAALHLSYDRLHEHDKLIYAILGLLSVIWIWVCDWNGQRKAAVNSWPAFQLFHRSKRFIFSVVILGICIAALGEATWEFIKSHFLQ